MGSTSVNLELSTAVDLDRPVRVAIGITAGGEAAPTAAGQLTV
jgi:hypothetical protein